MTGKVGARRYARAVFEIALENKQLELWQSDLVKIATAADDPTFAHWLDNPKVRIEEKTGKLAQLLPGISPLALNLTKLLVTRGKVGLIGGIAEEFSRLVDVRQGIEHAEVITAVALSAEEVQSLATKLEAIVGKKVAIKSVVDPKVIGGFVARIDGKLLDGSTRTRLELLKKNMAGAGG